MSAVFFADLGLPEPDVFIGVGSGGQGFQTGKALIEVEKYLIGNQPDVVAVVGDTNAGVSGALAACKLGIPVVHYEAGARSYDWNMPEEINRRLLDSLSRFCFAPTKLCLQRLVFEGRGDDSWCVGDTLVETALDVASTLGDSSVLVEKYGLSKDNYGLLTIHRADNTDTPERLSSILSALNELDYPVLFPAHPRTLKNIKEFKLEDNISNLRLVDPLPYTSFMTLIRSAKFIVTDSGGVQQEAAIFKKHSLTVRDNTEWMETIFEGGNKLVKADHQELQLEINKIINGEVKKDLKNPFEIGASENSLKILIDAKAEGGLAYRRSNFFEQSYDNHLN
jgi:UDP-N-acetylglucosamine 2-epimerase